MCLHKCLVALRKRQQRGDCEKVSIPYRDDKLTNFLKSYFEGQGRIRMLLCINQRAEDYDENLVSHTVWPLTTSEYFNCTTFLI